MKKGRPLKWEDRRIVDKRIQAHDPEVIQEARRVFGENRKVRLKGRKHA